MDKYLQKYIKYKQKYIGLKDNLQDGGSNIISVKSIKNALVNIEEESYSILKMNLTESNKQVIQSIKIASGKEFDFYGNIDDLIDNKNNDISRLFEYFSLIGTNTEDLIKDFIKIIKNLVKTLSLGYNKKYCWMTIRSSKPNNLYVIPRWHCDGKYFKSDMYPGLQTKFVTVFKGPGTLLIESNEQAKQIYNNYLSESFKNTKPSINEIEGRKKLDEELTDSNIKKIQISNGEGLIFLAGHKNCTIHSEPNITEPRMFLSIVFADEVNIMDWRDRKTSKM